ncbi:MAG TPA: methyltransferase domain-containing protein [Candidatus Polarisedimenticolaceae bacterium]|nr:methyltransferase domain-containing protein [Candidatus Polarisedimenticolaceae bacterium]
MTVEYVDHASRRVERVYGVLARVYDDFFDWALGPGRRRAVACLGVAPGDRVLEVGVGTGLSLPLYPKGCEVVGIDISEPMLDRARARLGGLDGVRMRLLRMDARAIQFEDGYFDKVVAPYVVSVVPDPAAVLAEMARICRPGGTIIVVNRFLSRWRLFAALDRLLTPLSTWLGFRLDVPVTVVTQAPGLRLVREERVNMLGGWRLLVLERL